VAGVLLPYGLTASASASVRANGPTNPERLAHQLIQYPVGTADSAEPSGQAAPTISQIPGYRLSNVTNFAGSAIPTGWSRFSGPSAGDPGSSWLSNHVLVSGNMLQLNTSRSGGSWISGGICQCDVHFKYGAVFIRSRLTGPGPTQVEMLWPVSGGWPPELDFVETYGGVSSAQATLHYTSANLQIHKNIDINMTAWHTWGVVWSPTAIDYTVDGKVWASITQPSAIPDQPMSLHIQQQTWCSSNMACPTSSQSTDVNWIAEYSRIAPAPLSVGSFKGDSVHMSVAIRARIRELAKIISDRGDKGVTLTGYADGSLSRVSDLAVSRQRASNVKKYLQQQLALLNDSDVSVVAVGVGVGPNGAGAVTVNASVVSGKVFAQLK
jgi:outer membrane protein OmpA-like peptidoglycan-associated protein